VADHPIVCTLTPEALAARREALLPGLAKRAQSVETLADGYRLHFAPAPDLVSTIATVIDAERQCCQFLHFDLAVTPGLGPITLTLTGPEGTTDVLRSLLT
jgi:hypothetical protein